MRFFACVLFAATASATLLYTGLTLTSNNPNSCTGCTSGAPFGSADEVKRCLSNVPPACQYSLIIKHTDAPSDDGVITLCPKGLGFVLKDLAADFTNATYLTGSSMGFTASLPSSDTCTDYNWKSSSDSQCAYPSAGTAQTATVKNKALDIDDAIANVFEGNYNFQSKDATKTCASKFDQVVLRHMELRISVKGLQGTSAASDASKMFTVSMMMIVFVFGFLAH